MPVTKSDLLSDDVGTRQNDRIPYRELPAFELVLFIIETMRIDTILAATAGWQRHRVIEPTHKGNLESQSCVDLKHQPCQSCTRPIGSSDIEKMIVLALCDVPAVSECCACLSPAATYTLPGRIAHTGPWDVNL